MIKVKQEEIKAEKDPKKAKKLEKVRIDNNHIWIAFFGLEKFFCKKTLYWFLKKHFTRSIFVPHDI